MSENLLKRRPGVGASSPIHSCAPEFMRRSRTIARNHRQPEPEFIQSARPEHFKNFAVDLECFGHVLSS